MLGVLATAKTSAGKTRCCSFCAQLTCAASTPKGTLKPNGAQRSHTAKTMRATRPSQNVGVEDSK